MTRPHALSLAGATLEADLSGALIWPEESTLIVADLHLEKGSSFARHRRAQFLPPYDTRATVERLERLVADHDPKRVICLGDSIHDPEACGRIDAADADRIARLTNGRDWIWIAGNHDPDPPDSWGGRTLRELSIGPVSFRHQASKLPPEAGTAEISGHFHPTASVATRAARVSGRCFASDGIRAVLPAFGAYAGGLNVLDPSIARLFGAAFDVVMLGRRRLFAFSSAHLVA
ncbi:MAG TPA: ligase-associated DNA damage response endonuclease PdeM [Alphaproteobacteria bacterium]|nr:ligase-associated DNA damage response endonuclease PdeM [Alphaproteobacteria bacterium]